MRDVVDFNLHGLAGVRLVDADQGDVAAVARQLGPIRVPPQPALAREPEIVIRFVDRSPVAETPGSYLDYVELGQSASDGEKFFVLRGKHKTPARVQIPLARVGGRCEIVCQRGLAAVPFLIPMLNLTVLGQAGEPGPLPLHAGAFVSGGKGVLVTGWSKGGKTEALLGFMARGATYVADEWTYLYEDPAGSGQRLMAGIPEPVRVWEWHLREMPAYRRRLTRKQRAKLAALHVAARGLERATRRENAGAPVLLHRIRSLVKKQQGVNVPPQQLFAGRTAGGPVALDCVFFVVSSASPEIQVEAIKAREVARRMVFSLQEEQRQLWSLYRQFRFAFPEAENTLLECSQQIQAARLQQMLAGKEAFVVRHPYPVPIEAMAAAMERVIS